MPSDEHPISFSERESCRCGRPLIHSGDADPWCKGCNMSASTCDCVPAEARRAASSEPAEEDVE